MSFSVVKFTVSSGGLATSGTETVNYPGVKVATDFAVYGHKLKPNGFDELESPSDFTLTFGASDITVTYLGTTTIPEDTVCYLQLNEPGDDSGVIEDLDPNRVNRSAQAPVAVVNLGAPATADPDGIFDGVTATDSAQSYDSADFAGSFAGTLDVPRNLTLVGSAGANHVCTVTGKDEYGEVVVEQLTANGGTPVAGKKAFKEITSMAVAAGAAGDTLDLGWGDVLGLPMFVPGSGYLLAELEDGSAPTAGTLVKGVSSAATATTGDVRGTYDPNSACDGSAEFELILALTDVNYKGVSQYAG